MFAVARRRGSDCVHVCSPPIRQNDKFNGIGKRIGDARTRRNKMQKQVAETEDGIRKRAERRKCKARKKAVYVFTRLEVAEANVKRILETNSGASKRQKQER